MDLEVSNHPIITFYKKISLPVDIIAIILSSLPRKGKLTARLVCHAMKDIVTKYFIPVPKFFQMCVLGKVYLYSGLIDFFNNKDSDPFVLDGMALIKSSRMGHEEIVKILLDDYRINYFIKNNPASTCILFQVFMTELYWRHSKNTDLINKITNNTTKIWASSPYHICEYCRLFQVICIHSCEKPSKCKKWLTTFLDNIQYALPENITRVFQDFCSGDCAIQFLRILVNKEVLKSVQLTGENLETLLSNLDVSHLEVVLRSPYIGTKENCNKALEMAMTNREKYWKAIQLLLKIIPQKDIEPSPLFDPNTQSIEVCKKLSRSRLNKQNSKKTVLEMLEESKKKSNNIKKRKT